MPMRRRTIDDRVTGIVVELGAGDGTEARIAWVSGEEPLSPSSVLDRACWVDSSALAFGRWVPTRTEEGESVAPPIEVVCRATALAVGAWIKDGVLSALEGLP